MVPGAIGGPAALSHAPPTCSSLPRMSTSTTFGLLNRLEASVASITRSLMLRTPHVRSNSPISSLYKSLTVISSVNGVREPEELETERKFIPLGAFSPFQVKRDEYYDLKFDVAAAGGRARDTGGLFCFVSILFFFFRRLHPVWSGRNRAELTQKIEERYDFLLKLLETGKGQGEGRGLRTPHPPKTRKR